MVSLLVNLILICASSVFAQSFDAITVDKSSRTQRMEKVLFNNRSNEYIGVKLTLSNNVAVTGISTNPSLSFSYTSNLMNEVSIKDAITQSTNAMTIYTTNAITNVSLNAIYGSNTALAVSNLWSGNTNNFVITNDSRFINLQGQFSATNSVSTFHQGFRGDTSDVFEGGEWITADAVDKRIAATIAEIWYATTNAHPVIPATAGLSVIEPTTQFQITNVLSVGTNFLGKFAVTNLLYRNRYPAGEALGHYHVRVIGLGNPKIEVFWALAAVSADGSITNVLDTTTKEDISGITVLSEYDSRAHVSTNIYFSSPRYTTVLWYAVRTGGASGSLVTAGGGGLSTSLRTGNISNPTAAIDAYYTAIWASNSVVATSNQWTSNTNKFILTNDTRVIPELSFNSVITTQLTCNILTNKTRIIGTHTGGLTLSSCDDAGMHAVPIPYITLLPAGGTIGKFGTSYMSWNGGDEKITFSVPLYGDGSGLTNLTVSTAWEINMTGELTPAAAFNYDASWETNTEDNLTPK
jgi:hypothetical protein